MRLKKILAFLIILFFVLFITLQIYLRLASQYLIYDAGQCPTAEYGIIFGTSPFNRNGKANQHYWGRINLAAKLYRENKVKTLIISGDNQHKNYNEPQTMLSSLLELGVLKDDMMIDSLGLSTLETIKRSKKFYDENQKIILITQNYHLPRALMLAKKFNINAVGCKAQEPDGFSYWFVYFRELLARVKALMQIVFS